MFERLCLWLVRAEGYQSIEHYGPSGTDHGRDIVAYRPVPGGKQLWFFQCKRAIRVTRADLESEITKIVGFARSQLSHFPDGVVFVVAGRVSAKLRDGVRLHASRSGLECEFWAHTDLDAKVKRHPAIVQEFFQVSAAARSSSLVGKRALLLGASIGNRIALMPTPDDPAPSGLTELLELLDELQLDGVAAIAVRQGASLAMDRTEAGTITAGDIESLLYAIQRLADDIPAAWSDLDRVMLLLGRELYEAATLAVVDPNSFPERLTSLKMLGADERLPRNVKDELMSVLGSATPTSRFYETTSQLVRRIWTTM